MKMYQDYILENGNIIDVESGLTYQASIEIGNNRIQRIIPKHKDVGPTTDKQRIDLNGKWVIPGLLDMHCHIQEGYAPQFVASGVTTVRNTAGNVLQLEKLINAPLDAPTPRVYSADRMIDGPPGLWGPTSFGNFVTDSQKEAKEEVKRQVAAGAKFIKAYGWLSLEVMEAVVLEARKYGLEVSCDLIHSKEVNALDAAKIGVTWFEHASGFIQALYPDWSMQADQGIWKSIDWTVPDEKRIKDLCEKMLTYDVKLCPTMIINDQIEMMPHYWYPKNDVTKTLEIEGGLVEHWKTLSGQVESLQPMGLQNKFNQAVAKTYYDLGGTVVTGTDTPACIWTLPGMGLHRELELFVDIGFTPMEALQAATINAAKSINLHDIGVIKAGAIADLVILNKNPLENIKHTREIDRIIKGGRIYTQQEILEEIPDKTYLTKQGENFIEKFNDIMDKT